MNRAVRGRFAPSPTGRMHLGNIWAALLSWLSAKSQNGEWLLRIEDLDPQRSRLEYALQAEEDLRWLGLDWDLGGTEGRGSDLLQGPFLQSKRSHIYEEQLARLTAQGLTYPCYCTRADILATQAPHESDGRVVYKGTCRPKDALARRASEKCRVQSAECRVDSAECRVQSAECRVDSAECRVLSAECRVDSAKGIVQGRGATRLIVPDENILFTDRHYGEQRVNLATHCGDFIVRRADGAFAYQLAVVVDDALMGVTEVVRGRDLLLSSAQQIYLYRLLQYPVPEFSHFPLLCNTEGQRLSKRDKSLDMGELRKRYTPEGLLYMLAQSAGLIKEIPSLREKQGEISLSELLSVYDESQIPREDLLF